MEQSSVKYQSNEENDLSDEDFSLCISPDEGEIISVNKKSDFPNIIKKENNRKKFNKNEKIKLKKESGNKENQPKEKSNKKDNSKIKNKIHRSIKKPTFKIVLKKVLKKSKTKLKKDTTKNFKIENLTIKNDRKKKPNKIKAIADCCITLNENGASSSNDNKNHSKKIAKPPQVKKSKTTIANKENKIPEVEDSKQDQNHTKVVRSKKKSSDVILKPSIKKIKLQVGKKCVAVPVSDEKVEAFEPKISKKSSQAKVSRSIPKTRKNTEKQNNIQLQVDGDNTQESNETRMTPQPSIQESVNDGSTEPNNKTKTHVFNKMRQRLFENFGKTLTYEELEEMCIQKMCEAIYHKSEIGELRHQLNEQEEMSKRLRTEVRDLSKQADSLKKLNQLVLNQISALDASKKPLIQIKLVRSVGLQAQPSFFVNEK